MYKITRKKLITIFIAFSVLVLIIYGIVADPYDPKKDAPQTTPFQVETQNSNPVGVVEEWGGVEMGKDSLQQVKESFGPEIDAEELSGGNTLHKIEWKGVTTPLLVGSDATGRVVYMEISQSLVEKAEDRETYEGLINKFSLEMPTISLYVYNSPHEKIDVYADKGIAFRYEVGGKEILYVMYFTPMSGSTFVKTWGSRFSTTPEGLGN